MGWEAYDGNGDYVGAASGSALPFFGAVTVYCERGLELRYNRDGTAAVFGVPYVFYDQLDCQGVAFLDVRRLPMKLSRFDDNAAFLIYGAYYSNTLGPVVEVVKSLSRKDHRTGACVNRPSNVIGARSLTLIEPQPPLAVEFRFIDPFTTGPPPP